MNPLPTRYALLRDRRHWDGTTSALAFDADGTASLMSIPNPPSGVALPGPFAVLPSGLACIGCDGALVADTAHHQIVYVDGLCDTQARIPRTAGAGTGIGAFDTPRGIVFAPGRGLFIADSGNARIVLLRDPTLETVAIWTDGLTGPTALALDAEQRLYVVDGAAGRVLRLAPNGTPDPTFNAALAIAMGTQVARFVTVADDEVLHVSTGTGRLLRFGLDGSSLPALASLDTALTVGAIVAGGTLLYAADTTSGRIAVLDGVRGITLATLPRFVGPVTALAVCDDGMLLVKTGDDEACLRCPPTAVASAGTVEAGPLDAGARDAWFVAIGEAETPAGTGLELALYATDDVTLAPGTTDWVTAPGSSALVGNLFPAILPRYLWLRITLRSTDNRASPQLTQVHAETPGEDYLDQLPAIYLNADRGQNFLGRMLAALRVQFDRSERVIDALPLRLSIDFAPVAELGWIASWLGFDLPPGLPGAEQRALLHRVVKLYDRRWTSSGIAELVHVYTGVRPRITEAWRDRHLWQLGVDSALGFDTGLAPQDPAGMVVPDPTLLRGSAPANDCAVPERLTIGSVVVGAGGPLTHDAFGSPLFTDAAHRFIVSVPAYQAAEPAVREAIRHLLDREKPAHTDYSLCFVEAEMRVGQQAVLGIDTYIAAQPAGASLERMTLDLDAYLADTDGTSHLSSKARLGLDTRLA